MTFRAPHVLLQAIDPESRRLGWWRFRDPLEIHVAERLEDVVPALEAAEAATAAGSWAAGFLAYEAGPAFDPKLTAAAARPDDVPLAWLGIFAPPERVPAPRPPRPPKAAALDLEWRPLLDRRHHAAAIARIHDAIARGLTYQVNYTFPLEAAFDGDPAALFAALAAAQRARHAAYVDTGRFAVCSASPELFFSRDGDDVLARPMKGTARRGRYPEEDRRRIDELEASAKNRAENVMIVDMVRNDLGKIAATGSVRVDELCRVETYPTVHQLTSTVSARVAASPGSPVSTVEIFRALFPSASITGAPKIETSRIIGELENGPRGVYTGSVGVLAPGRRASWNVAIRTVTVDRQTRRARYGTGGGIVWDSRAAEEYEECRTKAFVLRASTPPFELLETLLWRPKSGYWLLERHLGRLAASAEYFGFPWNDDAVRRRLDAASTSFDGRTRLRLLHDRRGRTRLEAQAAPCPGRTLWTVAVDDRPVDSGDLFLFHKTTHRRVYNEAAARHPTCDDVILWNERGELTETTRGNLVVVRDGHHLTPPQDAGLLAGTYRAELLERGRLREATLDRATLEDAEAVFLINSVRGFVRLRIHPAEADHRPKGTT